MKNFFFLLAALFQCVFSCAQSGNNYQGYTNRIVQFSKPARVLYKNIDAQGTGSIEFVNAKKQILRFRVDKGKLQTLHGQIAFQLFLYENNYLQKIATFDANGNLAGERESKNEAVTQFIILKKEEYLKKQKLIDAAEGNIEMKDDSREKIIQVQLFDVYNLPIIELQPTYISSKTYWQYQDKMYWP
ncbi:hypothetical protein GKZ90_0014870 [Flavobacterium sp. MC2016-06]|jgi:hypothetical protein|uniref:hypothetical protein n=1 Tax=Flavobacterium sp. MC2016-06 TaxID=2676308 RepID=UPI0012BAE6CD|nr:hypothetical protein [Flavobacterium sp. MC2016-06]MBU3859303.1 hypothetical protein [Flavobacterium sp. MC2016-06]